MNTIISPDCLLGCASVASIAILAFLEYRPSLRRILGR